MTSSKSWHDHRQRKRDWWLIGVVVVAVFGVVAAISALEIVRL
jgi:hypothetical protein